MFRWLLGVSLLLLCATASAETERIVRSPTWRLCRVDSDCVVVQSMCPNTYWAINKEYIWQNSRSNEHLRNVVTCTGKAEKVPESVTCEGGLCVGH